MFYCFQKKLINFQWLLLTAGMLTVLYGCGTESDASSESHDPDGWEHVGGAAYATVCVL